MTSTALIWLLVVVGGCRRWGLCDYVVDGCKRGELTGCVGSGWASKSDALRGVSLLFTAKKVAILDCAPYDSVKSQKHESFFGFPS